MRVSFIKMHGLGNDFVVLDARDDDLPPVAERDRDMERFGSHARTVAQARAWSPQRYSSSSSRTVRPSVSAAA